MSDLIETQLNQVSVVLFVFLDCFVWSGITNTVLHDDYEKSKLRVSVVIFGRATPVELEFGQIEKEI